MHEIDVRRAQFEREGTGGLADGTTIGSVFLGGGTPSLMRPQDVNLILRKLAAQFQFSSDIEITLETNPGTITRDGFAAFADAGINRFSIGVQSFNDKYLGKFGRIHDGAAATRAIEAAMSVPRVRVSADLIYGFPEQTPEEWQDDLKTLLNLGTSHLSCYVLMAEEGTIYTRDLQRGLIPEQDQDRLSLMMETTYAHCSKYGRPAYEISNFASPGQESRHNLGYWHYHDFLGLGAGAVGQYSTRDRGVKRFQNIKSPAQYMQGVFTEQWSSIEDVSSSSAMSEFMMMGLRLVEGIRHSDFKSRFDRDVLDVFFLAIQDAESQDLLSVTNSSLRPTDKGLRFNNRLVELFV